VLVIAEGVYSMDGDVAPLMELLELKERHGFTLMIDDAHGIGVLGPQGVGIVRREVAHLVDVHVGTFGKAFGGYGAFVACSASLKEYLINSSRPFIFSTAPPPPVVAAAMSALEIVRNETERRVRLLRMAAWVRRELRLKYGLNSPSRSHLVPFLLF